jgi:branched-chain amino acid transport system substrate-binding protein
MLREIQLLGMAALLTCPAFAARGETPITTPSEIVIGQTLPYSGPVSSAATIGRAHAAYFSMLNQKGGINGRKVRLISLDDGFSPPKTVEHTRKLVEQDEVLLIFGSLGTATNQATQRYLNAKHVPQLFLNTGANNFNDPKNSPYTMAGLPSYGTEAAIFAQYILKNLPDAKIAVLSQNDDYGRDYVSSFKAALGAKADKMIVAQATYEVSEPTIASQIVTLNSSKADVLMNFTLGKYTAQTIKKVQELGWKPVQFVPYVVSSVKVLAPGADPKIAAGIITTAFAKSASDPAWKDDPEFREWLAWMKEYYPAGDATDDLNVFAYVSAELLAHVLADAKDDLSRENIMRLSANLQHVRVPMLLPGIEFNSSNSDYAIIRKLELLQFNGSQWTKLDD